MARVLCIHGIAQEYKSRETLLADWAPAVAGGVSNARGTLDQSDVDMAFYGLLFRPSGSPAKGGEIPNFKPGDLDDPLEQAMLSDLVDGLDVSGAQVDLAKGAPGKRTVAAMLRVVGEAPLVGRPAQRLVIWGLKQVRLYLSDPEIRRAAQNALLERVAADTRVVLGHSLGSIVAYETLCANPGLPVRALVTIGSPLGIPAILPRLLPPSAVGKGTWPTGIAAWTNVADRADLVALRRDLRSIYGDRVADLVVQNGATMHDAIPYLTAPETGKAIIDALSLA